MSRSIEHVCVVGAGPVGLATAIALRRQGYSVTAVDCATPPIDKACGEGLMPEGVEALAVLGVELQSDIGRAFQGIRFCWNDSSVSANFPGSPALGLRRTVLHDLLVQRAESCGTALIWGAKHVSLADSGVRVNDQLVKAQFVVGADGQNSQIRRRTGLALGMRERRRLGFRRHYRVEPWSPYVEVHWRYGCQVYITPVARDEVCVAAISRSGLRLRDALPHFPELNRRLARAEPISGERGGVSVSRKLRNVYHGNVALIGDASGSVDAVTGEGLSLGFRQSIAFARALKNGNLEEYRRDHASIMRRPRAMQAALLGLDLNSELQRRGLRALEQCPEVFASLLKAHIGASPLLDLGATQLLGLGFSFLAA